MDAELTRITLPSVINIVERIETKQSAKTAKNERATYRRQHPSNLAPNSY